MINQVVPFFSKNQSLFRHFFTNRVYKFDQYCSWQTLQKKGGQRSFVPGSRKLLHSCTFLCVFFRSKIDLILAVAMIRAHTIMAHHQDTRWRCFILEDMKNARKAKVAPRSLVLFIACAPSRPLKWGQFWIEKKAKKGAWMEKFPRARDERSLSPLFLESLPWAILIKFVNAVGKKVAEKRLVFADIRDNLVDRFSLSFFLCFLCNTLYPKS